MADAESCYAPLPGVVSKRIRPWVVVQVLGVAVIFALGVIIGHQSLGKPKVGPLSRSLLSIDTNDEHQPLSKRSFAPPAPPVPLSNAEQFASPSSNPVQPSDVGRWTSFVPGTDSSAWGSILGMQSVHMTLLPSGKLLLASGSSWRNAFPIDQTWPRTAPRPSEGLFNKAQDPFLWSKWTGYYDLVNNVGLLDPEQKAFYRIPHPAPQPDPLNASIFQPTDLFCTGHQHLPNGDVLFVGGTQYYLPYRTGHRSSFTFRWRRELEQSWPSFDWETAPPQPPVPPATAPTAAAGSGASAGGSGAPAGGGSASAGGSGAPAGGSGAPAGGSGAPAGGSGAPAGGSGASADGGELPPDAKRKRAAAGTTPGRKRAAAVAAAGTTPTTKKRAAAATKPTTKKRAAADSPAAGTPASVPTDVWTFTGFTERGRWYPSIVPMANGRMVVYSGFVGFDQGYEDMYQFETNTWVEFFDARAYETWTRTPTPPPLPNLWQKIDAKNLANSPYTTLLNRDDWTAAVYDCQPARACVDYEKDAFKLYPQSYLLTDGRIYLTREGDWNSMRTQTGQYMRNTRFTYFMNIDDRNPAAVQLAFQAGPLRPDFVTSSGTTVLEPDNGNILLTGGMSNGGGTLLPGLVDANSDEANDPLLANLYAGSRGSRKLEIYRSGSANQNGTWTLWDPDFLGATADLDRTMHYATLLPTKQILIIGGGNYDFYGAVMSPILLTPIGAGAYNRTFMAPSYQGRLYHSGAILLPDARVLAIGGNAARATVDTSAPLAEPPIAGGQKKPNLKRVNLDSYFFGDGPIGIGHTAAASENWVADIFSPPYLFIDPSGRRPAILNLIAVDGSTINFPIGGKVYSLLKSGGQYDAVMDGAMLPTGCEPARGVFSLIKLGVVTHGWDHGQRMYTMLPVAERPYQFRLPSIANAPNMAPGFYMLFYVDCAGVPSVARMVRFDNLATEV